MKTPGISSKSIKVVVYAGPTGGHLFPAQAFAESFKKVCPDCRIEFVTSRRAARFVINFPEGLFDKIRYLPDFGFSHKVFSFQSLKPFLLAPYLFFISGWHLLKFRPDLCVGFGSFVSYPGMRMAAWMRVPTLIHEQNVQPGKATCWLASHMDAIAESFRGTKLPSGSRKTYAIGLPLRSFILERSGVATNRLAGPLRLLVMGGSQGAQGLNRIVLESFAALADEEKSKFVVTHITGSQDHETIARKYHELGVSATVHSFYKNMFELFQKTDLAVSRAGANTLFELAFYGIPTFAIPFPYAGAHQRLNAKVFSQGGGLEFHDEDPEAPEWLTKKMKIVMNNENYLGKMAKAMKKLAMPDAGIRLAEIALGLLGK